MWELMLGVLRVCLVVLNFEWEMGREDDIEICLCKAEEKWKVC